MDLTKYRNLFLEEATEHLAEMDRSLRELEKAPTGVEAIDSVFRMVHSIKGMAASLGYDAISELAHRLEDRMHASRASGRVDPGELELLFRGLEGLERLIAEVRGGAEGTPRDPQLAPDPAGELPAEETPRKKARPRG